MLQELAAMKRLNISTTVEPAAAEGVQPLSPAQKIKLHRVRQVTNDDDEQRVAFCASDVKYQSVIDVVTKQLQWEVLLSR